MSGFDINLLAVVQSERQRRSAPAVVAGELKLGKVPSVELEPRRWRRLRNHFGEIHRAAKVRVNIASLKDSLFILPGKGHKVEEILEELISVGVSVFECRQFDAFGFSATSIKSLAAYLSSLLLACSIRLVIAARLSKKSNIYLNVIFNYAWLRRIIRNNPTTGHWIIIGDLSPFLIALSGALRKENHRIASWQYGYQDFKRYPLRPNLAIVLNRKGFDLARVEGASCHILTFQRDTIRPSPVKFSAQRKGVVGILLNAFSVPDISEKIKLIQEHLGCHVLVRPHPRDRNLDFSQMSQSIAISDCGSLEQFCNKIDWVICGNSTSALKVLGQGFPVCQYFNLDSFFEDHFQYERLGLIPAFHDVTEIAEKGLVEFYENQELSETMLELFGQIGVNNVKPLKEIKRYIVTS